MGIFRIVWVLWFFAKKHLRPLWIRPETFWIKLCITTEFWKKSIQDLFSLDAAHTWCICRSCMLLVVSVLYNYHFGYLCFTCIRFNACACDSSPRPKYVWWYCIVPDLQIYFSDRRLVLINVLSKTLLGLLEYITVNHTQTATTYICSLK